MATQTTDLVITDVTLCFSDSTDTCPKYDPNRWSPIKKDLYLRQLTTQHAWLCVQWKRLVDVVDEDEVVTQVAMENGQRAWESRPGDMWILRCHARDVDYESMEADVDVLFGTDAIDPRRGWTLAEAPLKLDGRLDSPPPRVTIKHGRSWLKPDVPLTLNEDESFKILQISDLHFGTGPGICEDAIDEHGDLLRPSEADPQSVQFIGQALDVERPNLAVVAGDQVDFGRAPDTQTAILKYAAPLIDRCIPFAVIFGNHHDEGPPSLPRLEQMQLLQSLPYCVSQPGPQDIDGVGNYCLTIECSPTQRGSLALFFLDTHNQLPVKGEVYDWIKQSQIDWFQATSRGLKKSLESMKLLSLAFIHIPLPEYNEPDLTIAGGSKREEVMSPTFNSHFYDALVDEGVAGVSCGHDHVNDYCALRPGKDGHTRLGPWLCYGGGSGFGGYGGYCGYHRRVRVFNIDTKMKRIETWKRVEYRKDKVDHLVLVEDESVVAPERNIA